MEASIFLTDNAIHFTPEEVRNCHHALLCFGRGCDGFTVQLLLKEEPPVEVLVVDKSYVLPPGGEAFSQVRPATVVITHFGDESIIMNRMGL